MGTEKSDGYRRRLHLRTQLVDGETSEGGGHLKACSPNTGHWREEETEWEQVENQHRNQGANSNRFGNT